MELLKKDVTKKFKQGDVEFTVRTTVSVGDKYELDNSGELQKNGTVQFSVKSYCEKLIRLFVVDWEGVTRDGKDVPWDADVFFAEFPSPEGKDLVLELGLFVADATGINKSEKRQDLKNV